jgi:tetratricopeptide (TPR) repeat protein
MLFILSALLVAKQNAYCGISSNKDSSLIHNCDVPLPSWWSTVSVSLPDSINSIDDLRDYSSLFKDSLVVMKLWYTGIKRMDLFPAYIADAWFNTRHYDAALSMYKQMLPCIENEKGRREEWECYLCYMIGKTYESKKEKEQAIEWYRKAIDQKFSLAGGKTKATYELALCAYRCLMNIRCDK